MDAHGRVLYLERIRPFVHDVRTLVLDERIQLFLFTLQLSFR